MAQGARPVDATRLAILCAAALVLAAACGGATPTPTPPPSGAPTSVAAVPTPTPPPPPSAAPATSGPTATADASCATAPAGLVGWWRAEDDATDAAGAHDGALQGGASFGGGLVGRAFTFDGNGQFVEVASSPDLQLTSALTIEAWVFAAGAPAAYAGIVGTWDDFGVAERTYLLWALNGRVEFILSRDLGETPRVADTDLLPTDRWVHLAATFDGTTMRLYRDGAEVASSPLEGALATNDNPFRIGRTDGGSVGPNFWKGSIDELSVYDRALDAAGVAAIVAAGATGKCA